MKKAITFLLFVCMMIPMLTSCSKPPELSEIKPRIEMLLLEAIEINDIFFGEGLPVSGEHTGAYYVAVDESAKYKTQAQIKEAAKKVYSSSYLTSIDKIIFEDFEDSENDVTTPRYREVDGVLYKYINSDNLIKYVREYDTSTINIIKPSNSSYVAFEINSYGYILNTDTMKHELTWKVIELSLSLEDSVWLLDEPTY